MQNSFSSTIARSNYRPKQMDTPVSTTQCDTKTLESLRTALIDELKAITNYENWASGINNENIRRVLRSIRDEERVHAGEILALIEIVCPEEANLFTQGRDEVMQMLNNIAQKY